MPAGVADGVPAGVAEGAAVGAPGGGGEGLGAAGGTRRPWPGAPGGGGGIFAVGLLGVMLPVGRLVGALGLVGVPLGALVGERVGALLGTFFVGALVVQAPQETSTLQRNMPAHQQRSQRTADATADITEVS